MMRGDADGGQFRGLLRVWEEEQEQEEEEKEEEEEEEKRNQFRRIPHLHP